MRRTRTTRLATLALLAGLLIPVGLAEAKTFAPTTTADPNPGACTARDCSLREAVIAANDRLGPDTIVLEAKTYRLTRGALSEDNPRRGDLDLTDNLTIVGAGAGRTAIAGAWRSDPTRHFDLHAGARLAASKLTLRGGDGEDDYGSAIRVRDEGVLNLRQARVTENENGYGAVASDGRATINRVLFRQNRFIGGCCPAFYNMWGAPGGIAKLTEVTFDRNRASSDTGAMYSEGERAALRNVTFSRNRAGTLGGALITGQTTTTLTNVTFSQNRAGIHGGAIYQESGAVTPLNNVTMTENVADADGDGSGSGGGIYATGGDLDIVNSILAGNRAAEGSGTDQCGSAGTSAESLGFNLIRGAFACGPTQPTDVSGPPRLGALADNGGFTQTHALLTGSAAINRGNPAEPGSVTDACAKRDQRGVRRPQRGRCDIGAYERR